MSEETPIAVERVSARRRNPQERGTVRRADRCYALIEVAKQSISRQEIAECTREIIEILIIMAQCDHVPVLLGILHECINTCIIHIPPCTVNILRNCISISVYAQGSVKILDANILTAAPCKWEIDIGPTKLDALGDGYKALRLGDANMLREYLRQNIGTSDNKNANVVNICTDILTNRYRYELEMHCLLQIVDIVNTNSSVTFSMPDSEELYEKQHKLGLIA